VPLAAPNTVVTARTLGKSRATGGRLYRHFRDACSGQGPACLGILSAVGITSEVWAPVHRHSCANGWHGPGVVDSSRLVCYVTARIVYMPASLRLAAARASSAIASAIGSHSGDGSS